MIWTMEPTVIADRYELTAPVGSGGMGTVWEGFDTVLDRPVAVKLIHADLLGDNDPRNEYRRRFRREARILARLDHPGVPEVYDFGVSPDGNAYLVMRHVFGATVADLAAECAPLSTGWVAALGAQLMGVLSALHRPGLLHRDVKPANLILTPAGRLVLCDFGIAGSVHSGEYSRITRTGERLGTTGYRAPEVADGATATVAADLWAAGVVLRELADEVDGPVAEVIAALTDPDPVRRPSSARHAGQRLAAMVPGTLPDIPGFTDLLAVPDALRLYLRGAPTAPIEGGRGVAPIEWTPPVGADRVDTDAVRRRVEHLIAEDRPAQVIPLIEQTLASTESDDLVTLSLRYDLARCREAVGDALQAIDGYEATAAGARGQLGESHPLVEVCDQAVARLTPAALARE